MRAEEGCELLHLADSSFRLLGNQLLHPYRVFVAQQSPVGDHLPRFIGDCCGELARRDRTGDVLIVAFGVDARVPFPLLAVLSPSAPHVGARFAQG